MRAMRGADLLENTCLHLYLQQCLGFATPDYLHLPLVNNADGVKLSKQTGALTSPAAGVEVFMDAAARLNSTLFDITEVRTPAPALTTTGACMVADVTAHRHVCHCAL